jgi:hypothetical protein
VSLLLQPVVSYSIFFSCVVQNLRIMQFPCSHRHTDKCLKPTINAWSFQIDNDFARDLIRDTGRQALYPRMGVLSLPTCERCHELDFWSLTFELDETVNALSEKASRCNFCRLLFNVCRHLPGKSVRFYRSGSVIKLDGVEHPVLSICGSPGKHRAFRL